RLFAGSAEHKSSPSRASCLVAAQGFLIEPEDNTITRRYALLKRLRKFLNFRRQQNARSTRAVFYALLDFKAPLLQLGICAFNVNLARVIDENAGLMRSRHHGEFRSVLDVGFSVEHAAGLNIVSNQSANLLVTVRH